MTEAFVLDAFTDVLHPTESVPEKKSHAAFILKHAGYEEAASTVRSFSDRELAEVRRHHDIRARHRYLEQDKPEHPWKIQ